MLCLQYDDNVIISGSSDSTVRVWSVKTGEMVNTLIHHCEAVLHLRFSNDMMVTCSKVGVVPCLPVLLRVLMSKRDLFRTICDHFTG